MDIWLTPSPSIFTWFMDAPLTKYAKMFFFMDIALGPACDRVDMILKWANDYGVVMHGGLFVTNGSVCLFPLGLIECCPNKGLTV